MFTKVAAVAALTLGLTAQSRQAQAQDFVFNTGDTVIPQGTGDRIIEAFYPAAQGRGLGTNLELQMQPFINTLAATLQSEVEARLNKLNLAPLVSKSATAGAAAARATSVDHASFIKVFSMTAAGSGAVTGFDGLSALAQPSQLSDDVQNGVAPNFGAAPGASAMVGFNFAALNLKKHRFFDPSRLQLYVSAMYVAFNYNGDEVRAQSQNYGAHFKYQLLAPNNLSHNTLARWGGLNVSSGLTWMGTDIQFNTALPNGSSEQNAPITVGTLTDTLTLRGVWSGDADIKLKLRAYTVPIEISSYLQLLHVFTLFGGLAMDLNFGSLSVDASARAPLTISASAQNTSAAVDVLTPKPTLAFAMKKTPVVIDGRVFLGLQLNFGVVALYGQGMVDTSQTVMASVGLRGFY